MITTSNFIEIKCKFDLYWKQFINLTSSIILVTNKAYLVTIIIIFFGGCLSMILDSKFIGIKLGIWHNY